MFKLEMNSKKMLFTVSAVILLIFACVYFCYPHSSATLQPEAQFRLGEFRLGLKEDELKARTPKELICQDDGPDGRRSCLAQNWPFQSASSRLFSEEHLTIEHLTAVIVKGVASMLLFDLERRELDVATVAARIAVLEKNLGAPTHCPLKDFRAGQPADVILDARCEWHHEGEKLSLYHTDGRLVILMAER